MFTDSPFLEFQFDLEKKDNLSFYRVLVVGFEDKVSDA